MNHLPKSRTLSFAAIVCWALITSALPVSAQQPPPQGTVKLEANLVQVDAVVTNKRGEFVSGLTKGDFELSEAGRPVEITFFSEWSRSRSVPTAAAHASGIPAGGSFSASEQTLTQPYGIFVIVLDDIHLASDDLQRVRDPLVKLLSREFRSGDRVALLTTSGRKWPFAQLSQDPTALSTVLKDAGLLQSVNRPSFDKPLSAFRAFLIDQEGEDSEVAQLTQHEFVNEGNGTAAGMVLSLAREVIQRSVQAANDVLAVLLETIDELRRAPGKKAVILVSSGFVPRGSGFSSGATLERVAGAATRAGVVVHTIDARGLVSIVPAGDASERGSGIGPNEIQLKISLLNREIETTRQPLRDIAAMTGGIALDNNNNLAAQLSRAVEASSLGYSLAFYPSDDQKSTQFRRLRLSIKGRSDLTVRSREGYYPGLLEGGRKTQIERTDSQRILLQLVPSNDFEIMFQSALVPGTNGRVAVRVSAEISGPALPFRNAPDKHEISLRFIGVLYTQDGKVVEGFDKTLGSELQDASFERLLRTGISYRYKYDHLKAGRYVSRVAVIDLHSDRAGQASNWIEVPSADSQEITIGGPFLFESGGRTPWDLRDGFSTISDYRFHATSPLEILTFILRRREPDRSPLKVSALLRPLSASAESLVITNFRLREGGTQTAQGYSARLPGVVPPGTYNLQVFAEDANGKAASPPVQFLLQFP